MGLFDHAYLVELDSEIKPEKLSIIARIFDLSRQIGIEKMKIKTSKYYWNDSFDKLYDSDMDELWLLERSLENIKHQMDYPIIY